MSLLFDTTRNFFPERTISNSIIETFSEYFSANSSITIISLNRRTFPCCTTQSSSRKDMISQMRWFMKSRSKQKVATSISIGSYYAKINKVTTIDQTIYNPLTYLCRNVHAYRHRSNQQHCHHDQSSSLQLCRH